MINNFYNSTATIKRLTYSGNKGTYANQTTIVGHLQQANPFFQQQLAQIYTLSHLFWCASDALVNINDNLTIDNITYSVKGIQSNNYGVNKHKELHLEKLN